MKPPLRLRNLSVAAGAVMLALAPFSARADEISPHAGMMRYADVSGTQIVFAYGNDLWLVSRDGGSASPLSSPSGEETFPRFSADGKTIAFVGNYDGNRDIYTIPVTGGVPTRVTHHPSGEWLQDWTPDGRLLYCANGSSGLMRQQCLFTVAATGGLPERLSVPYGATAAISPDGTWLAYTPHSIDSRTWKRYRGGMQTDIWLFNLKTSEAKRITDWEGTDSLPMWHKDTVYYLSDQGPEHRGNIWKYDPRTGKHAQVTSFKDFDVKWPSIGPGASGDGEIVFGLGPDLHLLDLKSEKSKAVKISIPGDRPRIRPQVVSTRDMIRGGDLSSSGKRVVLEARGDIYTVPAKEGATLNLTRTSGAQERSPSWSPDGKWIAYFSDESGEYELYVRASDGTGQPRQVTKGSKTFYYNPNWSPDSKRIAYSDKGGNCYLTTVESGETKVFDTEPWSGQPAMSWSQDSDWVAYAKGEPSAISALWVYQISKDAKTRLTSGVFADNAPTFDRKGDFLYYASTRDFSAPAYEDVGNSFIYGETGVVLAVPLRKDVKSPLLAKNDDEDWREKDKKKKEEEEKKAKEAESKPATQAADSKPASQAADSKPADAKDGDTKDEAKKDDKDKKEEVKPLVIDLDGFEQRAVQLPIKRGNFGGMAVNSDGHLIYYRGGSRMGDDEDGPGPRGALKIIDLSSDEKEEKTVAAGVGGFSISADGKKLLVIKSFSDAAVVDAKADQKLDKKVPVDDVRAEVDPRAEWKQILREAWRIERDFFYDPHMHGVDWDAVYKQYEAMLADCVSREDVSFLIREMISELNVGHAYYFGGDEENQPSISVGMLGCDFALENGAYRIKTIYTGGPWDSDARNPLLASGVDVKPDSYLLKVNGAALDTAKDPWAAFAGLAGKTAVLTIGENPAIDDQSRDVVVKLLGSESDLRYRSWIERNRAYVEEKSGGQVGYIYVPDTGINGQNNLFRQFYGQTEKAALIIDERWNGGGQIPTRFIELLNRPPDSQQGPKCMLINGLAGSGGDMFPWLFRFNKLGKLIGTRTWGGLVGISGNPGLVDGGGITAPTFAFYEKDGTWGVEGHGVDPDMEVLDDPSKMVGYATAAKDPQLDAAIDLMLKEIQSSGYKPPKRPAYPDRKGMGIKPEDK
ncbi:MAG: PD40 domain-containing protein [Planctomycetes bacterium]|nr:PD40 domain-containing protein [Planctomycetota bacterium]